ncbi:hypothetical protein PINS_up008642 [Pythium insidiosum]|nr:hypothetical protein PINS_up008642 [Pythium insidiosum]
MGTRTAPERRLAESLHDAARDATRREAAASLCAPALSMGSLLPDADLVLSQQPAVSRHQLMMPLHLCLERAVGYVSDAKREVLFIAANINPILRQVASMIRQRISDGKDPEAALRLVRCFQTRDIHEVIACLYQLQRREQEAEDSNGKVALVVIGPCAQFLAPFMTTNRITVTGQGLFRMLQLTCQRVGFGLRAPEIRLVHHDKRYSLS